MSHWGKVGEFCHIFFSVSDPVPKSDPQKMCVFDPRFDPQPDTFEHTFFVSVLSGLAPQFDLTPNRSVPTPPNHPSKPTLTFDPWEGSKLPPV